MVRLLHPKASTTKITAESIRDQSWEEFPAHEVHSSAAGRIVPGSEYWKTPEISAAWEYIEVLGVIGSLTVVGWFVPVSYRAFGPIYLLAVTLLSLRVGQWPVLTAAIVSAVAWNFVFMPPRLSFSVLHIDDSLMLGTYFVAALIVGVLTARIREQERYERQREQREAALFHLIRELAAARSLDETAETALRMADRLFKARTALLLNSQDGRLELHPSSSLQLSESEYAMAAWTLQHGQPAGRFTEVMSESENLHLPMVRADLVLGVFVVCLPPEVTRLTAKQRDLLDGFTAQIALLVEREQLCTAREHEKLLAESDRLHRTLFDSVSHELKTPLAVLRSAGEKLGTGDQEKQLRLAGEIRTATRRLDHLVANLLNQTRLESGRLKLQLDWCEVQEVIDTARRSVGAALHGRPVKIEIAPDMPLFKADAVLMEQVLANLLLNAALHTPAGSAVRLTAGLDREHTQVFIAVSDSGPGIPPEITGNLFQKFSRGAKTPAGGLGLGLSIVRGFMLAQGGDVSAGRSEEGGACFTVRLPYTAHDSVPNDER